MQKIKIISTIIIFGMLLGVTSTIKTKTRIIEKKITKLESNLIKIKRNLHETQLDFFYLSSPSQLEKKINELSLTEYLPMDYSRIYLNLDNFLNFQKKITKNKLKNEEKAKK
tara:strand:+ start:340 stop:675 length:336 start_codon:yes stop_codon:yes gene_type:complete